MKCQDMFSGKIKKNISMRSCLLLKKFPSMLSINFGPWVHFAHFCDKIVCQVLGDLFYGMML